MSIYFNNINYIAELTEFSYTSSDIEFYATQIMLRYLTSANLNELKKQSVTKFLTLFIWIGKSEILSSKGRSFLETTLKEIFDSFQLKELPRILKQLLGSLKNHNSKIHILEHLLDLEDVFHSQNKFPKANKETLLAKLNLLAKKLKDLTSSIQIMQIERALRELKKFTNQDLQPINLKQADQKINLIVNHLAA